MTVTLRSACSKGRPRPRTPARLARSRSRSTDQASLGTNGTTQASHVPVSTSIALEWLEPPPPSAPTRDETRTLRPEPGRPSRAVGRQLVLVVLLGVGLASLACSGGAGEAPPPSGTGDVGPGEGSAQPDAAPQTTASSRADAASAPHKRLFVTSARFDGNLQQAGNAPDGVSGADKLCQAAATGARGKPQNSVSTVVSM